MSTSGVFLDYHGHLDCLVLDSLLLKLRKTREFEDLNTITRKRTYALFVESIENIIKHSALTSSDDINVQPYVSISDEDDKIIILSRNPVSEESRSKLTKRLEIINNLDVLKLRRMQAKRFNSVPVKGANGAGLGFIFMAYKSGNKLSYRFNPLITGYLNFEIKISLNK